MDKNVLIIFIIVLILAIILSILSDKLVKFLKTNKVYIYKRKDFLTTTEKNFLFSLTDLETKYHIIPKINLNNVIKSDRNEFNYNVDFAIFDKTYTKLLLLIELKTNDKVKKICENTGIRLVIIDSKSNRNDIVKTLINILNEEEIKEKLSTSN